MGCFWGDCSLSNVLYRYDAAALDVTMVDGETVELHDVLSAGQRRSDLEIMVLNVAGGMADIAAEARGAIDDADMTLGAEVVERYERLWTELNTDWLIGPNEGYRIAERTARLNDLGFEAAGVELEPVENGRRLRLKVEVGGRTYHRHRLSQLTSIEATENQARQILSDLRYHEAKSAEPSINKAVTAIRWRVGVFEPMLAAIERLPGRTGDTVQLYCDFLNYRYTLSYDRGRDVPNEEAFAEWVAAGMPGHSLP